MFLDILQIIPGQTVLDVGCGYGVIGAIAAKQGAGWVDLVDDNLLAVASSRKTLAINHISNAAVFAGDLLQPVENHKYDLILTNPPFHAGHAVNLLTAEALINQAHQALNPGGQLILVANRFLPYDRLVQVVFGNATLLSKSNKFHVISGINTPNEKINQEGK
jgi:16S rRNA (guanine1207-N2)-methyltransferase